MRNKRGIELALNSIIIAAIALIVLIVIVVGFTGGFNKVYQKLMGIGNQAGNKADCIVLGSSEKDGDGDGYIKGTYEVEYRDEEGNEKTLTCQCDINDNDNTKHVDDSNTLTIKYC